MDKYRGSPLGKILGIILKINKRGTQTNQPEDKVFDNYA